MALALIAAPLPIARAAAVAATPAVSIETDVLGPADSLRVALFREVPLHFGADSAGTLTAAGEGMADSGRIASARLAMPHLEGPHRIFADLTLHPVPRTEREVFDRWDRAGNVRLVFPGRADVELVRFMTSYGGRTDHTVDVSDLAPLLAGSSAVRAFVDTWTSPAWRLDLSLRVVPDTTWDPPAWAAPLLYTDSYDRERTPRGLEATVDVPKGMRRVVIRFLSTGHCTDGRDEDEFVSKANVIAIDGRVVARVHPWRNDCRRFRERNPYCARWTDGSWSSDYSRSGWCPGDVVTPMEFDVSDALTPGRHRITVRIEDVRPKDANGHFGYWRVSASVIGWDHPPKLWRN